MCIKSLYSLYIKSHFSTLTNIQTPLISWRKEKCRQPREQVRVCVCYPQHTCPSLLTPEAMLPLCSGHCCRTVAGWLRTAQMAARAESWALPAAKRAYTNADA